MDIRIDFHLEALNGAVVDLADAITVLHRLFAGAGDLPAPFGARGIDPTSDTLDCISYTQCAAE